MAFSIMDVKTGNKLNHKMAMFIYDMICLQEYTDEDIETIKAYENENALIDAYIEGAKIFKVKYVLLKRELPSPENVKFHLDFELGDINPKILLTEIMTAGPQAHSNPIVDTNLP
jgi:hypothetical protein